MAEWYVFYWNKYCSLASKNIPEGISFNQHVTILSMSRKMIDVKLRARVILRGRWQSLINRLEFHLLPRTSRATDKKKRII